MLDDYKLATSTFADPPPVWDPSRFRCSKLLMNLLEEDELEATVKVVPIPWYHTEAWGCMAPTHACRKTFCGITAVCRTYILKMMHVFFLFIHLQ